MKTVTLGLIAGAMLAGCVHPFRLVDVGADGRSRQSFGADEYLCYLEAKASIPPLTGGQLAAGFAFGPLGAHMTGWNAEDRKEAMKPAAADCLTRRGYTVRH